MCTCVRVRACMCVCARARACVRACVLGGIVEGRGAYFGALFVLADLVSRQQSMF